MDHPLEVESYVQGLCFLVEGKVFFELKQLWRMHRHIVPIGRCKICLASDDDLMLHWSSVSVHVSFGVEAQSWMDFSLPRLHGSTSWSRDITCDSRFSNSDRAKMIIVMWAIWNLRNSWMHDGRSFDPVNSLIMAKEAITVLEIPHKYTAILHGHGWRPLMLMSWKLIRTVV
jgi:hypothetical protein